MAESGADAEAFRLKSNQWSSSTLVKGMSSTAQQPFGLLAFGEQDKDLEEQLTELKVELAAIDSEPEGSAPTVGQEEASVATEDAYSTLSSEDASGFKDLPNGHQPGTPMAHAVRNQASPQLQSPPPPGTNVPNVQSRVHNPSVPDMQDGSVPRPTAGHVRLSPEALYHKMYRVFHPRSMKARQKKVSDVFVKQWEKGGTARTGLEQIFQSCGYNPDEFVLQLQFIQSESLEQSLVVEGQFATEEDMRSWGWSEARITAVKTEARKDPRHLMRKDRYEPQKLMYWAETCVKGSTSRSNKLEMNKKLNLEEQADAQALNGFMQPRAIVPGGSMLPLPSQGSLPSGLNGGNEGQQVGNIKPKTEKKHHQQEPETLSSDGGSDHEGAEDLGVQDAAMEARKKAGIPELPPDAPPSMYATKFLTCIAKRLKPLEKLLQRFSIEDLTDLQLRMKVKTQKLMADLQDSDTKIGDAYTNGVVDGFSVQAESAMLKLQEEATQRALESFQFEARARPFLPKEVKDKAKDGTGPHRPKPSEAKGGKPKAKAKAKGKSKASKNAEDDAKVTPSSKRSRNS